MVSPAQRRQGVSWARQAYRVSERRASRVLGVARSTVRYRSRRDGRELLRRRIREIAGARVSYGYRQVHTLLRREGWPVNHKQVYRLYREEGLPLRRRRPKRRRSTVQRQPAPMPKQANARWAMDLMQDTLSGGCTLRVLTVLDVHTRECVALKVGRSFKGEDVAGTLSEAGG